MQSIAPFRCLCPFSNFTHSQHFLLQFIKHIEIAFGSHNTFENQFTKHSADSSHSNSKSNSPHSNSKSTSPHSTAMPNWA
ncbi:MAG: hypothetical protein IJ122_04640 [Methanobrevibacter sp.]|nr:hypothetical protein [Methanobrevibacter sp.]